MADATVEVWKSMDAAKIKALYAPSVEAYDFVAPGLSKDRAEFDKRQDAFAAAKLDGAKQVERKIQILSPDVFVMSGTWQLPQTRGADLTMALGRGRARSRRQGAPSPAP